MSKIDIHNYEAYMLDAIEGNLSAEDQLALDAFLDQHPELKDELDFELNEAQLVDSDLQLSDADKSYLKREETTALSRADYLMIASVEGELSHAEQEELSLLLESEPKLLKELDAFQKTRLKAEPITYSNKSELKRSIVRPLYTRIISYSAAAAAIIALFLIDFSSPEQQYSFKQTQISGLVESNVSDPGFRYVLEQDLNQESKESYLESPKETIKQSQFESQNLASIDQNDSENIKEGSKEEESKPLDHLAEDLSPMDQIAEKPLEQKSQEQEELTPQELPVASNESLAAKTETTSDSEEDQGLPIKDFAIKKVKEDLLKNKTFSEILSDEIAELTNDKVQLPAKTETKEERQFALNLGGFSISRK